jgi:putative two-component system response regulator
MEISRIAAGATILIVDDEQLNIDMLQLLLRKAGYLNILSTTDPNQAAPLYATHYPDLVLLDINMPGKDGFAVLQELRKVERRSYLPVMVLSAATDEASRIRALELGARQFLHKPFSQIEVTIRIHNMLEVRLLHRELRNQNKILEKKVQERTQELLATQLEIVQRLGLAAEHRDNETGAHIMRMSHYSELLARAHALPRQDCELILNASPMHDIGKIGTADAILLKPGKLTVEEFEIMKAHTTIGADLLANGKSQLMETARIIALTHHEKWDGSGYPYGLRGEAIPIMGRIVAVCDVFDALTSERPYKRAWSVAAAVQEIVRMQGKHFDPQLVDHFLRILPEIIQIKDLYTDINTDTPEP